MITLNIASHKPREQHLQEVLKDCLKQRTKPDAINVYLNGYTSIPKWMPKGVNAVCGKDYGASAKFYFAKGQKSGVYITLDDDLIPDAGYVGYMADMAMKHPDCIVGLHGTTYGRHPVKSYYTDEKRTVHYCYAGKKDNSFVDMLGTGALAFRVGLGLDIDAFPVNNMTDPYLCKWAKETKTPMLCLLRSGGFVKEIEAAQGSAIWHSVARNDSKQTDVINSVKKFQTYSSKPYNVGALNDGSLEWGHMKIIANAVRTGEKMIEFGSGLSTEYWNKCGINLTSFEHHKEWANKTGANYYPIKDGWYDFDGDIECDVLLIDGPIGSTGNRYNLPIERLSKDIRVIFVDDCHREKDLKQAHEIAEKMGRSIKFHKGVQKILAEIT